MAGIPRRPQDLAAEAVGLAAQYPEHQALRSLSAAAVQGGQYERVVLLGGNGNGKSTLLDTLALIMLERPELEEEGELRFGGDYPRMPRVSLLAAQLQQDEEEAAAAAAPALAGVIVVNPEPHSRPMHISDVLTSFRNFHANAAEAFGTRSLLLPVGAADGSTTQGPTRIFYDAVPACRIKPRSKKALQELVEEMLESMTSTVLNRETYENSSEEYLIYENEEFKWQADLFKVLTGRDVQALCEAGGTLEVVLDGLHAEQEQHGSLLLPSLAAVADNLQVVVCTGAQENLSSDVWFLKEAIADPVAVLVRHALDPVATAAAIEALLPPARGGREPGQPSCSPPRKNRKLQGLLVVDIEITLPCKGLGSLMLIDLPGLGDEQPWVSHCIQEALQADKCDHILLIALKNLSTEKEAMKYLIEQSDWCSRQLSDLEGTRGRLMVLHHQERGIRPFSLPRMLGGVVANRNHLSSMDRLRVRLRKPTIGPADLSPAARAQLVEQFIDRRVVCFTACPTAFCSLGQATAVEAFAALEAQYAALPEDERDIDIEMYRNMSRQEVFNNLVFATHMDTMLRALFQLPSLQEEGRLGMMLDEVDRALEALPLDGAGADGGSEQAMMQRFQEQLQSYLDTPSLIENIVYGTRQQLREFLEPQLRGVLSQAEALRAAKHRDTYLSDARIDLMAQQLCDLLKDTCDMNQIRRTCKLNRNRNMQIRGGPPVVGQLMNNLMVPWTAGERETVLAAVRQFASANQTADQLLTTSFGLAFRNSPPLLDFLRGDGNLWTHQLLGRFQAELRRPAEAWLNSQAFNDDLHNLVLNRMRFHLQQVADAHAPWTPKRTFLPALKAGIVSALTEVRAQLLARLADGGQVNGYVDDQIMTPLVMAVSNKRNIVYRMAALGHQATTRLAMEREQQPCLWRCIYRFLSAAHDIVAGRGAANVEQQQRAQELRHKLEQLRGRLEMARQAFTGPGALELQTALANSLAAAALQHTRQAQIAMHRGHRQRGVLLRVQWKHPALQLYNFAAYCGDVDLRGAGEDGASPVQAMFDTLADHSIYWQQVLPEFGPNSALEAAYMSMHGRGAAMVDRGKALATLREIVAYELSLDMTALIQNLGRVDGLQGQTVANYLIDLENGQRWGSLLELQGLAKAMSINFILFSAQPNPFSTSGRLIAYFVSSTQPAETATGLKGYPLAVVMRRDSGVVRPHFLPLFFNKQLTEDAKRGVLQPPPGNDIDGAAGGSGALRGDEASVRRTLEMMTYRAAFSPSATKRQRRESLT